MTASVVVPFRPDGGHRTRLWDWTRRRWSTLLPTYEVVESTDDGGPNPGVFNHPLAINRGVKRAESDVLVIADADTTFLDWRWVVDAVRLVRSGEAAWVLPQRYVRLDVAATMRLLDQDPAMPVNVGQPAWVGIVWGGLVVVPRAGFEEVHGYETRFTHWGADDVCFGLAMNTLWGEAVRLEGECVHLWHAAPISETYGHERHPAQYRMTTHYTRAAGDRRAMRQLVDRSRAE